MTDANLQHARFMRRAIELSLQKMDAGEGGPFGAVIVHQGRIIGEGWNRVTSSCDPTAHAEIVAIRAACEALGTFHLSNCEIYTSCEPCPMCLSAIYWARIERIFYGNDRHQAAAIDFDDEWLYREVALPAPQRAVTMTRLLADEAQLVFKRWLAKPDRIPY